MSQRQTSLSEDDFDSPPAGPRTVPFPHVAPSEPQAPSRGRRSARTPMRHPRRRGLPLPPPARTPADSPASSYGSGKHQPQLNPPGSACSPSDRLAASFANPSTAASLFLLEAYSPSAWPHRLLDSAPLPATFNSELTAQASAWPHWPPFIAPPPVPITSGLAAQASAGPHLLSNTAPPPASFKSSFITSASFLSSPKDYSIPKTCHSYSFELGKMQRSSWPSQRKSHSLITKVNASLKCKK
ncbi:Protocadherin Fat 3 [Labeo rohita]|uniref:Protocadherin Fat 3 n=1 Tax=Labeo rohita TaxID=84645 RepID=A0ABQ8M2S7_LABRO|nr:Protocadherin Fat 3 [Labeo rohita]